MRSATTSKAMASDLSMIEILERGTWSNKSTWQMFYKKDIIPIRTETSTSTSKHLLEYLVLSIKTTPPLLSYFRMHKSLFCDS